MTIESSCTAADATGVVSDAAACAAVTAEGARAVELAFDRPCSSHDGEGVHVATSDPIAEIIGDYRAFATMQRDRLLTRGIDIAPYALSHLAVRVSDWDLYVHQRTLLERHARANRENLWNGRPSR
jgi:hypothetical protein